MGCCASIPRSESPYNAANPQQAAQDAAALPDSSRAAINRPARSLSNIGASGRTSSVLPQPVARPNVPIRAPTPIAKSPAHIGQHPPPWTRSQIERERVAFFDTRVTGRKEVWDAVRYACEMLKSGNVSDAQGILDAANISCPNGRVASGRGKDRIKGGIYDERGELYDVPAWVISDPRDLIEDGQEKMYDGAADESSEDEDMKGGSASLPASLPKEEKGKGRAEDMGEMVKLRARLSDRGTDVTVEIGMKQKISVAIRAIQSQLAESKRVRIVYLGKALQEGKTLAECGWRKGDVVNALVFEGDEATLVKK